MNISRLHKDDAVGKQKVKNIKMFPTAILSPPLNKKMYTKAEIVNS